MGRQGTEADTPVAHIFAHTHALLSIRLYAQTTSWKIELLGISRWHNRALHQAWALWWQGPVGLGRLCLHEASPAPRGHAVADTHSQAWTTIWVHLPRDCLLLAPGLSLFLEHILVLSLWLFNFGFQSVFLAIRMWGLILTPLSRKPALCLTLGSQCGHLLQRQQRGPLFPLLPNRTYQPCQPSPHLSTTTSPLGQNSDVSVRYSGEHTHTPCFIVLPSALLF